MKNLTEKLFSTVANSLSTSDANATGVRVALKELWERELLRFRDLKALGIVEDRATLRRWMNPKGDDPFPSPIVLSGNSVAWVTLEVRAWLDRRPRGVAPQPRHKEAERRAAETPASA
jgi:predicted DNA-binding transcriptional regulator AlpA